MGTSSPELLIALDRSRRRGLRAQLEDELRAAIRSGRLGPGAPIPSSRALAADLQITRKVVVEAYDQLVAEGYLVARRGARTTVRDIPPPSAPPAPMTTPTPVVEIDFRPGRPDLALFPRAAWSRATHAALRALPDADLTDDDPRGLTILRHALAEYLGRVRGVTAEPERIVVCAGFGHGFDLAREALVGRGCERFAVEDPGYPGPRRRLGAGFDAVPGDSAACDPAPGDRRPAIRCPSTSTGWSSTGCATPRLEPWSSRPRTRARPVWCSRPAAGTSWSSGPARSMGS